MTDQPDYGEGPPEWIEGRQAYRDGMRREDGPRDSFGFIEYLWDSGWDYEWERDGMPEQVTAASAPAEVVDESMIDPTIPF